MHYIAPPGVSAQHIGNNPAEGTGKDPLVYVADGSVNLLLPGRTLKEKVEALEERLVRDTLDRSKWNHTRAAHELGLSRVGLANKVKRYGIRRAGDE